ncbi:MAG: LamG domain-containing protein [Sphingobacteriales bacterium]|uniref:LamG domain-containing protein n=1 Tax=Hydrotalea flava TaxID=714549 RepID=UPI00082A407A|nr:LamG domain-containing protein [Hydrotalea flava]RTL55704.1 MAG: LamG domain-containing protein [Sphingobacteriales bacterium]
MKRNKKYNILTYMAVLLLLASGFSSCQKSFDPASYAPAQTFGGYTTSREIAASNLVGYWGFENSLIDSVSNKNGNGVGTSFTTGIKGNALQGANNGYFITTPSSAVVGLKSFTISFWVNSPQNTNGTFGLVCLSNTQDFWGNIDIFFENGSTPTNANLKAHIENWVNPTTDNDQWLGTFAAGNIWNKWSHIVLTYDATTSTFVTYLNGSAINTTVKAGNGPLTFQNASALIFGTMQFNTTPSLGTAGGAQGWASYMPGAMDEVRIYNKAIAAADVKALYQLQNLGK